MSKRIDLVYLGDMLDAARRVLVKTTDKTIEDFNDDDNLQLAIVHLIQVIGEAASRVSEEVRSRYPGVPWGAVIGMRHRLVHDYGNINYDIIWRVAVDEIPRLITALEKTVPGVP
jgi:uncharacterized protein with HEPN domain